MPRSASEWAFFSADYAVHEERWNDVAIRIFHHPGHTAHLERMVRSVRASLDYYTAQFGPYPYRHLSSSSIPGNGTGMHAEASMITYAEGFSLWNPKDDPGSLDLPFAVVAHEMAHQWTVPYALVEGAAGDVARASPGTPRCRSWRTPRGASSCGGS